MDTDALAMGDSKERKRRAIDDRINQLKEKLRQLEVKQTVKSKRKAPSTAQMIKLRKALIKSLEVFEADKDQVPLEVLSLSKRLVHSINEFEEQMTRNDDAEAQPESDDGEAKDEIIF